MKYDLKIHHHRSIRLQGQDYILLQFVVKIENIYLVILKMI